MGVAFAYFLWAFGPPAAYLFYLGRDSHALLALTSFNGFGLGWLRDFKEMRRYVELSENGGRAPRHVQAASTWPGLSFGRMIAAVVLGSWWAYAACSLLPPLEDVPPEVAEKARAPHAFLSLVLEAAGASIGVWLVGTLPPVTSSFGATVSGAVAGALASRAVAHPELESLKPYLAPIGALCALGWRRAWVPPTARRKGVCRRGVGLLAALALCWSAALLGVYQHGAIVYNDGAGLQRVRVKEAVYHVVKSEMFQKLLKGELFDESFRANFEGGDWHSRWDKMAKGMDVTGEAHAAKVLGVARDADLPTIKAAYRELALQLHPDKVGATTDDEKADAEAKFREVQEAYELLKSRRKK